MHATNVQPFSVLDVFAVIAHCSESPAALELAIALRTIATGQILLPLGPQGERMARRIGRRLRHSQRVASARVTLHDATTSYLAHHFFQWCVRCVPTHSPNPLMDETWLPRVRILYSLDPGLRLLADSLVNRFDLPDDNDAAVEASVTPAPSIAATAPASASSAPSPPPDAIYARLIARLRVVVRAKRFIEQFARHWNAQKARSAAQIPIVHNSQVPAPSSIKPVPTPTYEPPRVEAPLHEQAIDHRKTMRFAYRRTRRSLTFMPTSLTNAVRSEMQIPLKQERPVEMHTPAQSPSPAAS